ncbi:hypothetical protein SOVF_206140 isoform B [Spinacia oleracea]|uniref:Regulatory protein RecX n=1 Tax=Spinacia oleracea TaxID=3562 RepID=A0A9R0I3A5_SPIOL|nr:uncharacterized protein LOC110782083 isoform X2 [Spinacia oleracea]KNA03747.1 hypothetical protein SOVF_206140 isoform B [Spinacia oleracea]
MSTNLMIKLSINLQPRLASLPWLKSSVVRCFSHKADGSELPVRYIPKKHQDLKQAGCSSSGDKTSKKGIRPRSSPRNGIRGCKTLNMIKPPRGSRTDHEQSNVSFVNAHVLDEDGKDGSHGTIAVETESLRNFQEVVEYMNVPGEVVHELQNFKRDGQGQGYNLNQENSCYDEATDNEFLEEDVEETKLYEGIGEGKQEISKPCRTKQDAENLTIELLAKKSLALFSGDKASKKGIRPRSNSSNGTSGHKTSDSINFPRGSRIDRKQSNVSLVNAHVNEDSKDDTIAVEKKSLRKFQEVVEYMDVPGEVVHELQISKRESLGQWCNLNQKNSYYDEATDTECLEELVEDVDETQLFDEIGEAKQEISKPGRTKQGAQKMAIELLAKRAYTGVELRKKLIAKGFSVNIVEALVTDFQNRGLINDRLYAEMFSHSRWKASSWGPRRIKQALVKKGVSEGDVEKAVKLVFEDGEERDIRSSTKLSSTSLQQLYVQCSKQWQLSRNVTHEKRKARVIRWLQYRGFDWAVVSTILKKLESEFPP